MEILLALLERSSIMASMNKLSPERRGQVARALVEGNSIRATCRMTSVAKGTVLKLLADIGDLRREYEDGLPRALGAAATAAMAGRE